jgi:hypothetical protein
MKSMPERSPVLVRVGAALALAASALTACSGGGDAAPRPTGTATSEATPSFTPTVEVSHTKSPAEIAIVQQAALSAYVKSDTRNVQIAESTQRIGERIVRNRSTVGPFDFFNTDNDTWSSRASSGETAGWGWLQHRADFGGIGTSVQLIVYKDKNGKIATSKGVKGLIIEIPQSKFDVQITAPDDPTSLYPSDSWGVAIVDGQKLQNNDPDYRVQVGGRFQTELDSVAAAEAIDERALALAKQAMEKLGI